ncbi:MAG: hypothetical protein CM15mP31_2440 [Gammaproteobacteria bacterium]|nr:MAG: hypothetical protein CM15mP31_2440 [Gammaproteobacteria bacterium]
MKFFRLLLLLFLALQTQSEQLKNILFVGNSYLYYNNSVHNYVEPMLREHHGSEIETKLSAIGGSKLHHHNIDHLLNPKNLNLDQQIDLLIMQGGSTEVVSEKDQEKFIQTVQQYSAKAQKLGVKTALYMTHAFTEADRRFEPNLIKKITKTYFAAGKESNSIVIPVGLAYEIAYKERPNIKLHHVDGTHPSQLGTYLGAATVFASITGKSPEGLEFDYYGAINDEDRVFLQKIAWKAYGNWQRRVMVKIND